MINQKMLNADHDTSVMLALRRYIAQKIRAFIQFAWNIFTVQQFANLLGLAFLCKQLFDLARLSSRPLEAADLKSFIARSNELVAQLAQKA